MALRAEFDQPVTLGFNPALTLHPSLSGAVQVPDAGLVAFRPGTLEWMISQAARRGSQQLNGYGDVLVDEPAILGLDGLTLGLPQVWSNPEPFQPGTHLRSPRWFYFHDGIYVGNRQVIEFAGNRRKDMATASVRLSSLDRFRDGRRVFPVHYRGSTLPREEIVRRAYSQLGRVGYNLVAANCEHIARWCVTGRWESTQVRAGFGTVGVLWALALVL